MFAWNFDEWSPLRALSACGQIPHKNPGKGQPPPPFRQCLYFGSIWTGNPSLTNCPFEFGVKNKIGLIRPLMFYGQERPRWHGCSVLAPSRANQPNPKPFKQDAGQLIIISLITPPSVKWKIKHMAHFSVSQSHVQLLRKKYSDEQSWIMIKILQIQIHLYKNIGRLGVKV